MDCQKHLFTLPEGHHYLNCAYLSPLMKSVEEAGIMGIRQKRAPWHVEPQDFFENSDRLRSLFAKLINAKARDNIAILPSTSYGISTITKNLTPKPGGKVVIAGEQFPSNVYPWKRYCEMHDVELSIVKSPAGNTNRAEEWNQRLLKAVNKDTIAVAMANVHWTDGTLFDLTALSERARRNDACFIVDGTQSVGALPIDIQQIRPDALICSGYKWLMGPYSIALGYFGPRFSGGIPLEEGWIVRKGSENFADLVNYRDEYQPGAVRYDVGGRSNFILVPMMAEALQQLLEWDPSNIQRYCRDITEGIGQPLRSAGYRIDDGQWRSHHLFGIRLPEGTDKNSLKESLTDRNIHVSVRGNAIRVSPNVYNDRNDVDTLVSVLTSHQ